MKLHNSLNWTQCKKCGEIIPWHLSSFFNHFYNYKTIIDAIDFVSLDVASKLRSSNIRHCEEITEPYPVIVPPTWNKTEYHSTLSRVWKRAASELSTAENIIVTGYSLPESDSFFRYLFALGSVGQTRIKRFWVFDPNIQEVQPRFEKLIGSGIKNRFRAEKGTFSDCIRVVENEFPSES